MTMSIHPRIPILDHGYVQLIETWGSDERIVESARMSTSGAFRGWGKMEDCDVCNGRGIRESPMCPGVGTCGFCIRGKRINKPGDEKLLRYLYENHHSTPFEFGGLVIEVQAPIMVFREWHRHRTQSYTEMSARYSPLPDSHYLPTAERCLVVNGANKQANAVKGAEMLTHESALEWLEALSAYYAMGEALYQDGLRRGIPKELARLPVAVGRYSRMRASTCLRNWLAFLTLRSDLHPEGGAAQWEIRQFANAVGVLLTEAFPRTMELFTGAAAGTA